MKMRISVALILVALSATAFAKPPKDSSVRFYDFDELLIDGQYRKPQVLWSDARQKVKFERLLKLKKDFLPKLLETAKDPVFR